MVGRLRLLLNTTLKATRTRWSFFMNESRLIKKKKKNTSGLATVWQCHKEYFCLLTMYLLK